MFKRNGIWPASATSVIVLAASVFWPGAAIGQQAPAERASSQQAERTDRGGVRVVYTVDQMPHRAPHSLDEMSAAGLEAPDEFTRSDLVRYGGVVAADSLRQLDRALREQHRIKTVNQRVGSDN